MDSFPEHNNSKQASQAKPTIEAIKEWDADELLEWLKQIRPKLFNDDQHEKFKAADIPGEVFLLKAGNVKFFQNECNLPIGPSLDLADLAREMAGRKTTNTSTSKARKTSLDEALSEEGLTAEARRGLSALTEEERIRVLRHIGTKPLPDDEYNGLALLTEHLPCGWSDKESILRHPDESFIFPHIGKQALFVRKCYHDLYNILMKLRTAAVSSTRVLLTGTAGIGKSTFLIYFIIRYLYEFSRAPDSSENAAATLQNDEHSVVSSGRMRHVLIFQSVRSEDEFYAIAGPDILRKGTYRDFEAFLLLRTTWYLVDWRPRLGARDVSAATLFVLSPNSIRDRDFNHFDKVLLLSLCMPVWTYDELEKCRQNVFPELSKEFLDYIYDRVGGMPRSCLEAPARALGHRLDEEYARESGVRRLQAALNAVNDPLDVLRVQEESMKVSGWLLHQVPDSETGYEDRGQRVWASAYVIDRFVNRVDPRSASNMTRQVMHGLTWKKRDRRLGKIFECYVRHLFFRAGGARLRKRRLYRALDKRKESEPQQWFTVPQGLAHKPFSAMADFSIPEDDAGTIWTPGPHFPGVDMILTPNSLFQITIPPHHPVKQEPWQKILEKLPVKKKISLYFVVPESIFETFTFENHHNEQGQVSQKMPKSKVMLEQWVLGVPLGRPLNEETAEQSEIHGMEKGAANEGDMRQPKTLKKRKRNIPASNAEVEATN